MPQVEQQETADSSDGKQQVREQRLISGVHGCRRQHDQRGEDEEAGESIGTIDHVDRIDDAHRGEHGERNRQRSENQVFMAK
ncbi:MAG: hypothetical protein WAR01_08190 [Dokdonella sp.]|nr:hypothetical protein [Dokdonella sp.]